MEAYFAKLPAQTAIEIPSCKASTHVSKQASMHAQAIHFPLQIVIKPGSLPEIFVADVIFICLMMSFVLVMLLSPNKCSSSKRSEPHFFFLMENTPSLYSGFEIRPLLVMKMSEVLV